MSWFNEEQGNITGFDSASFSVVVTIPIESTEFEGDGAVVTGLTVAQATTSPEGDVQIPPQFFNFTEEVAGTVLTAGSTLEAAIEIELNLALELVYDFLVTLTADGVSGQECIGTEILSFTAGGSLTNDGLGTGCEGADGEGDKNGKDGKDKARD